MEEMQLHCEPFSFPDLVVVRGCRFDYGDIEAGRHVVSRTVLARIRHSLRHPRSSVRSLCPVAILSILHSRGAGVCPGILVVRLKSSPLAVLTDGQ